MIDIRKEALKMAGYTIDAEQPEVQDNIYYVDDGHRVMAVTEEEKDTALKNEIRASIWAFNSDFLVKYISGAENMTDREKQALDHSILLIQEKLCEDCNEILYKLIEDNFFNLVDDAEWEDGAGHFLNRYDGEEETQTISGQTIFIYKQD